MYRQHKIGDDIDKIIPSLVLSVFIGVDKED